MAAEAIRIRGLTELLNGLERADHALKLEVQNAIRDAGNIIRTDAEGRAATQIRNITEPWTHMRLGFAHNVAYIAPRERGTRNPVYRRPKFGLLLLDEAMNPAVEANRDRVERAAMDAIDDLNSNAGLISRLHAL